MSCNFMNENGMHVKEKAKKNGRLRSEDKLD